MSHDPRDGEWQLPEGTAIDRLDRVLKGLQPTCSWQQVRGLIARGKVAVDGRVVAAADAHVGPGQVLTVRVHTGPQSARAVQSLAIAGAPLFVHVDGHVAVVDKPAGLDTVPWTGADPATAAHADTLHRRVAQALGGAVRIVHRLDRDTTGLLLFARTVEAEHRLAQQFRRHSVHRRYLALVHGACAAQTIRSFLADDRGDGRRGSVAGEQFGKLAITHVDVRAPLRGATLVACRLETGRTHQIRIHLAERGHMLLGERAYVREHRGAVLPADRILLHAAELGFWHPSTEAPLQFALPLPADMQAAIAALAI